jgi:GT2 family glycosyltransferase/glycosyltransferase involved in cell wall biosynthesis
VRIASWYQAIVGKLLPPGTRRRYWGQLLPIGIRVIRNEGWRTFFRKFRIWFSSAVWQTGRTIYYWLPVSMSTKAKLVGFIMRFGGRLFRNVGTYRYWQQPQEMGPAYKQPSPHPGFYSASQREPFNFPDVPSPVISVIIPVHNKSKYTYACLYSIYENRPDVAFEVIVVDDCSTDDTQDMLGRIGGIQIIENAANLGFAGSVNCGAEVAHGEYLLILNNDTLVHYGWMDELFAVMSSRPDIGLVGSQLIYPNGRLQESGCLICQDGCAVALGRSENPLHPEFSYFREVDFCSAASVLVRKKEFRTVGGLSADYVPAYCEDVDFAFKLRGIGKRVFVQPLSKVTHYEAVSYGRNAYGDLIARNRRIFVEKWQRVLQQCPYATVENFRTTPVYNRKRVLYIEALIPKPDRGSSSVDAFWYMRFLIEAGYDVVFYGQHTPNFVPKYTPMLQRIGVQCLYLPYIQIERYLSEHGGSFSHVLVARVYLAMSFDSLIRRYCSNARYIFNTVDVHFLREMRQAEVEGSSITLEQAKRTKERELATIEQADATIVVSKDEKELLEREYGLKRIHHIPLPREVYGSKHRFTERHDLAFIGSAHSPNIDATYYFHSEIFPLIRRELPGINLIVIGEELRDALRGQRGFDVLARDPAVKLVGFVEDLSEHYDWVRVMVVPLRYGSGVKGKIITALSYGVPCVSTSIGSEGMGLNHGINILKADEPADFASEVVRLYTDEALWEKLSENGIKVVRENFSEKVVRRKFLKIFKQADAPYKEIIENS